MKINSGKIFNFYDVADTFWKNAKIEQIGSLEFYELQV